MRFLFQRNWHSDCKGMIAFAVDADRNASSEGGQSISTEAVADLTHCVRAGFVMRRHGSPPPSWCNSAVRLAGRRGPGERGDRTLGSSSMDYVKPADVAAAMVDSASNKLRLAPRDLLIRGILSGAILGVATSLAFGAAVSTGQPLVGAIIFPVGLVMIVLLGLELVTGSFGLLPLQWLEGGAAPGPIIANWGWVFLGNLIGSI